MNHTFPTTQPWRAPSSRALKSTFVLLFFFALSSALPLFALTLPAQAESDPHQFRTAHSNFFQLLSRGTPDIGMRALYQPENDEDGGPGSFDLQEYSFTSEFARPLTSDFYLRFGFDYDLRLLDLDQVQNARTSTNSETLHAFGFKIGAGWFLDENLLLTGTFEPGLYSDLDDSVDEDDFQYYGRGFLAYQMNPGTQLLAGILYDETFDDEPLLPIIGVRIQNSDGKLHLNLTFPTEVRLTYSVRPEFDIYGGYFLSGDEFQAELGDAKDVAIHFEERRLGGGANYYLNNTIGISAEAGVSLGSHLNFKTRDPGQFDDADLDPAFYVGLGLGFNL